MRFLLGDAAGDPWPLHSAQRRLPLQPPPPATAPQRRGPLPPPRGAQPGFAPHLPPRSSPRCRGPLRSAGGGPSPAPRSPPHPGAPTCAARCGAVRAAARHLLPRPRPAPSDKSGGVRRRETDCAAIGGGGARRAPVGPGGGGGGCGAADASAGPVGRRGRAPPPSLCSPAAPAAPPPPRRLPSAPRGAAGGSAPLRSAPHRTRYRTAPRYVCRRSPASSRPLPSRRGAPGPALRDAAGQGASGAGAWTVPPGAEQGARRHAGPCGAGAGAGAAAGRGVAGVRAERDGAHRAGGKVPRSVRLQPHLRPHRHGPRHLRALRQRQGRLLRHPQHQPRTLRDEQPHHDHLLRPGTSEYRQQLRLGAEHFYRAQERDLQF